MAATKSLNLYSLTMSVPVSSHPGTSASAAFTSVSDKVAMPVILSPPGPPVHSPAVSSSDSGADPLVEATRRLEAGEDVVLATAVRTDGAPPCRPGQKLLLGPGGPL